MIDSWGEGQEVQTVQGTETRSILGSKYFALKCTLYNAQNHVDVRGEGLSKYTNERFEKDFNEVRGDFQVSFDGTAIC